jgi:hypothetical protein
MSRHRTDVKTNPNGLAADDVLKRLHPDRQPPTEAIQLPTLKPQPRPLLPLLRSRALEVALELLVAFVGIEILCHSGGQGWAITTGVLLVLAAIGLIANNVHLVLKERQS